MKRSSLIASIAVIFILMAWLGELAGAYLQVFPREYDFGNVEVGVPETAVITTNVGLDPYEIESVVLSGSPCFSVILGSSELNNKKGGNWNEDK